MINEYFEKHIKKAFGDHSKRCCKLLHWRFIWFRRIGRILDDERGTVQHEESTSGQRLATLASGAVVGAVRWLRCRNWNVPGG